MSRGLSYCLPSAVIRPWGQPGNELKQTHLLKFWDVTKHGALTPTFLCTAAKGSFHSLSCTPVAFPLEAPPKASHCVSQETWALPLVCKPLAPASRPCPCPAFSLFQACQAVSAPGICRAVPSACPSLLLLLLLSSSHTDNVSDPPHQLCPRSLLTQSPLQCHQ